MPLGQIRSSFLPLRQLYSSLAFSSSIPLLFRLVLFILLPLPVHHRPSYQPQLRRIKLPPSRANSDPTAHLISLGGLTA